jgi:hypothetical protein
LAHGLVEVEADVRRVTLAGPPYDLIRLDFIAGADAAVTENAGLMVDSDNVGRIVAESVVAGRYRVIGQRSTASNHLFGDGFVIDQPVLTA